MVSGNPNIRFYAGAPLASGSGSALGSLCVIDREPRTLADAQRLALRILSQAVVTQMELRRRAARADGYLEAFAKHFPSPVWIKNGAGEFVMGNTALQDRFGVDAKTLRGKTERDFLPAETADRIRQEDDLVLSTNRPHQVMSKEGGRHWLVHKFPIDFMGDLLIGAAAIDVTQQVLHERQLERHSQFHNILARISAAASRASTVEAFASMSAGLVWQWRTCGTGGGCSSGAARVSRADDHVLIRFRSRSARA